MRYKKFSSIKYQYLTPHQDYQMTVFFLFVFFFVLFLAFYIFIDWQELDIMDYQWLYFLPAMIIYSSVCLTERSKIKEIEKINPLKRPIVHWVLLGLSVVALQINPNHIFFWEKLAGLNLAFVIFSIFTADSYWDFKKLKFRK